MKASEPSLVAWKNELLSFVGWMSLGDLGLAA